MTESDIPEPTGDLGFTYRVGKDGVVLISRNGRQITILRNKAAEKFVAQIASLDLHGEQQLMARVTGNFKHGNERKAGDHQRNR